MGLGSAIGAVGSIIGGNSARKEAKAARQASERQAALAAQYRQESIDTLTENKDITNIMQEYMNSMGAQGVEQAQQLLDSWEGTFGGIQDNLSDYFNNLDPAKYATEAKNKFSQNLQKQMTQFNETMAASGLQSAGMRQQAAKEAAFKTAETNAQIDMKAPEQVAQMQQGFLQFGEPQRQEAQSQFNSAFNNQTTLGIKGHEAQMNVNRNIAEAQLGQASASDKNAATYGASAAGYSQASGNLFGSAIKTGIDGLNDWQPDIFGMGG